MNVLAISTQKCYFLRMCYKGMFGLIQGCRVWHPVSGTAQSALDFAIVLHSTSLV